ncbi:MAG: alcohol dehydrogenase catalytic domain-containing protein [Luteolibacter sp.]
MNTTFEALVCKGVRALRYESIPFRNCGPTEVLVKIVSASICNGSDKNMYLGHPRYTYPFLFGHEPYGTVVEKGPLVKNLTAGDGVSWWFSLGAYAEYCYVDTAHVGIAKLNGVFDHAAASILELATATARTVHASAVHPDHRVLLIGMGPSGLIMTQQMRLKGVTDLEGWEVLPQRTRKAMDLGLASTFNPLCSREELDDYAATVRPFDLVVDCYPDDRRDDGATIRAATKVLKPGGTLIRYGHPFKARDFDQEEISNKKLQLIEPAMPMWVVQDLIEEQADLFVTGKLDLESLVTHRIGFRDIEATLLDQFENPDDYIKAVVEM